MGKPLTADVENRVWLDGEECFHMLYAGEMGRASSLVKVTRALYKRGIYNTETGRPFTTGGVFQSAWIWALNNIEEAEKLYKNYILLWGMNWNEENWRRLIHKRAHSYLTKAQTRQFLEDYPRFSI